ncbi:MAG: helix-turn-helix domain-containing protein [Cyanobacteria bacterium P01_F01_bin.143]
MTSLSTPPHDENKQEADELTTTQAAKILNISSSYLMKLINDDQIPYRQVGIHTKILLKDLLEYKKSRDANRKQGLQKLTDLSQELGFYDLERKRT